MAHSLVIETATRVLSVALFGEHGLLDYHHEELGRGHAEHLLPAIAKLRDGGRAEQIYVGCGPGSFTGVRVGIAAACGLAQGWQAQARGYNILALIAAAHAAHAKQADEGSEATERKRIAREQAIEKQERLVVMEGGHGQWFVQKYAADGTALSAVASLAPAQAIADDSHLVLGDRAEDFVERRGYGQAIAAFPDARDFVHLPAESRCLPLAPIYGRAPDAKPPNAQPKSQTTPQARIGS